MKNIQVLILQVGIEKVPNGEWLKWSSQFWSQTLEPFSSWNEQLKWFHERRTDLNKTGSRDTTHISKSADHIFLARISMKYQNRYGLVSSTNSVQSDPVPVREIEQIELSQVKEIIFIISFFFQRKFHMKYEFSLLSTVKIFRQNLFSFYDLIYK
jgi:hypothetical protein